MNEFGLRLKQSLKQAGYTQIKATEELELSKNVLSNYVKGRIPDAKILYRLSKLLNVSMEWLLTGEDNDSTNTNHHVSHILGELSNDETNLITLYRKLDKNDQLKIEGMIEIKIMESINQEKTTLSDCLSATSDISFKDLKHA